MTSDARLQNKRAVPGTGNVNSEADFIVTTYNLAFQRLNIMSVLRPLSKLPDINAASVLVSLTQLTLSQWRGEEAILEELC